MVHVLARLIGAVDVVQVYGREVWSPRWHRPDAGWGLRRSRYAVADCHATAEYVEQAYRAHERVAVLWDPVDTGRFTPGHPDPITLAKYQIPDPAKNFNVVTLGRISTGTVYKGYERLLEVFARLPINARLIYGGGGDLLPRLQKRAQALGVAERVVFTGFIDEADLPDIYRSASVFCLIGDRGPGRGEGIPLTPLEAGACGVPILVGDQDGSREAVEQDVNGFALDPFDLDAIERSLKLLLSDEPYRRRLGDAAHRRVLKEHAYPVFKARLQKFLERVSMDQDMRRRKL
jgi:phosphatidylinositol alpha-1,6-mannosyltransferase